MTTPAADRIQARTIDMITQGQQATLELLGSVSESWAEATRQLASTPGPIGLPVAAVEIVDRFFDTGVQVLEAQRALAHTMLGALDVSVAAPAAPSSGR
jgi:hypothetical protein